MALTDRLRDVLGPAHVGRTGESGGGVRPAADPAAAGVLGGQWATSAGQAVLVVDRSYAGEHRHGRIPIAAAQPPDGGAWPGIGLLSGQPSCREIPAGRLLFLDLETTGLAGGAGTYAFLVGCGWFDGDGFSVRQFFLSSVVSERAILEAVAVLAGSSAAVVTFNGRTFDVPLIDSRFSLHRLASPFERMPHVDMLHVARRFWRPLGDGAARRSEDDAARGHGCRLSDLERSVCGYAREGDVPGFEIPSRYFHYVRTGDAAPLEAVLEHNRQDLLSLALLTARAARLLQDGLEAACSSREALGVGRTYERAGLSGDACAAYARAAGFARWPVESEVDCASDTDAVTRAEALRALALLSRRERRHEDAALAWQRALETRDCPPEIAREAAEALAVHHEHRVRDLDAARRFAVRSLQYRTSPTRVQAIRHRLTRLERKLGTPATGAELF